jgi:hypothetical protein
MDPDQQIHLVNLVRILPEVYVAIGKYVGIGIAVNHQFLYFLNQLIQKKSFLTFEF